MIRLDEDDVPGNPGAAETPEIEARRLALEALSRPLDLDPPGYEGEAAEVMSQARGLPSPARDRPTLGGDALMAGMGPDDAIAPGRAAPSRVVQLSEEDVPAFTAPARPTASAAPAMMANIAPFSTRAAPPPQAPKSASRETALDADLRGASEQRARRMIANTLGAGVEVLGALSSGVPIQPGRPVMAGAGEDEAAIRARHRAAQMEKEQGARAESLAASRAEREATLEDRDFQLRQRGMDIAEQRANRTETPSDLDAARSDQIRAAMADRDARYLINSPQSQAARDEFTATIETLPPSMRARMEATFTPERVETMTAAEIASPLHRITSFQERGTGGGSGGGGGGTIAALRQRVIDGGGDPAVVNAMNRTELVRAAGAEAATESAEEILPGVRASIPLGRAEGPAIRNGFASARAQMANLRGISDVARRYGTTGVFSREAAAEMRPRLTTVRAMIAQLGDTGIITPAEVPVINAASPDPTSLEQMTIGSFETQMNVWRQTLEQRVAANLVARGVDEDGIRTALAMLNGGSAPRRQTAADERVPVRNADGVTQTVPRRQLELARRHGWTPVGGADAP